MGAITKIAWCDSTLNFWSGCTIVGPGCIHCYAEELARRFPTLGRWGKGAPRKLHKKAFRDAVRLNKSPWIADSYSTETDHPWMHRRRIFSLSLGDWLDPEVPIKWLVRMLDTIRKCGEVDWLLVTKRPELWSNRIEAAHDLIWKGDLSGEFRGFLRIPDKRMGTAFWLFEWLSGRPPQNVWVMASVENQEMADKRIPELLKIPAVVHGLSVEPLLGPIDLLLQNDGGVDWVIVGGESGPKARPCNVDWIRSIKDQCAKALVPCFVKQLGSNTFGCEWLPVGAELYDSKGGDPSEWPEDLRVQQWPARGK